MVQILYKYDELKPMAQETAEHYIMFEFGLTDMDSEYNDIKDFCRCFLFDCHGNAEGPDKRRRAFLMQQLEKSLDSLEKTGEQGHIDDLRLFLDKIKKTDQVAARFGQ